MEPEAGQAGWNRVEGTVTAVLFRNEENGYTVLKLDCGEKGEITAVGCMPGVAPGEVLGIVGESGSGKSTLAKCVLGMVTDITGELTVNSRRPQMVFQDPYGSLNPVKMVGWILEEPLRAAGIKDKRERRRRV